MTVEELKSSAKELRELLDKKDKLEKDKTNAIATLATVPFSIASAIASIFYRGWLFALAYLWFVVPVFHVAPITTGQAIGLTFIISFLRARMQLPDKTPTPHTASRMWTLIVMMWFCNFLSYFVAVFIHRFVH